MSEKREIHTPGPWMSTMVKYADWIIGGGLLAGWLVIVTMMLLS